MRLGLNIVGSVLLCLCCGCRAGENEYTPTEKRLLHSAQHVLDLYDAHNAAQKDSSASALMPRIRDVVAKMNTIMKEPESDETRSQLTKFGKDLSDLCQEASTRCQPNFNPSASLKNACQGYLRQKESRKPHNLSADDAALVAKADERAAQFVAQADTEATAPTEPSATVPTSAKTTAKESGKSAARKDAESDDSIAELRKKIVSADQTSMELIPQIAPMEGVLKRLNATTVNLLEKHKTLRAQQRAAESSKMPLDARQSIEKDIDKAWNEYSKSDKDLSDVKQKLNALKSKLLFANGQLNNSCISLRAEGRKSAYAQQLVDDPANQTAGEKKWKQTLTVTVVLKSGGTIEGTAIEDLGGIYKVTSFIGHTIDIQKNDVVEVKKAK